MSLATRCASCGTIFRVVQDQLRVSEGWVRCGRCQQVFNALENLFDLEREAPPPWQPPVQAAKSEPAATDWESTQHPDTQSGPVSGQPSDPAGLSTQPLLHTPSRDEEDVEASGFEDARFNVDLLDEETSAQMRPSPAVMQAAPPVTEDVPPEFLLKADRAARWQRPGVRAALAIAMLMLLLLFTGQVAVYARSQLAAQWPATRPVLETLCSTLGCRIEPLRRIESLAVDATGLTRLEATGTYKLSVVLHNRSPLPVMLPFIDLSLTDSQGQLVSRRALAPTEMGVHAESVAAGSDVSLQAVVSTGEKRIAGYTVEIFYP